MNYLLLVFSTLISSSKALIFKKIGTTSYSLKNVFLLNCFTFLFALIIAFFIAGRELVNIFHAAPYTVLLALVFSAIMLFTQVTQIIAMSLGSAASTTLIYSCGFLIPIIVSIIFWNETASIYQIFGVVLLLAALYLIVDPRKESFKASKKWLFFSFLSMSLSGLSAAFQKIQQRSNYADELPFFLIFAFIFSSLLSGLLHLISTKTAKKGETVKDPSEKSNKKQLLKLSLISGTCLGFANLLNFTLAGKIPSVIQFPIFNIGSMILTGIFSNILFHEKSNRTQITGFILGCAAIAIIGML